MGLIFLPLHQLLHRFQPDWYATFVPLLHPARRNSEASLETPAEMCYCRISSKRLALVYSKLPAGVVGSLGLSAYPCTKEEGLELLSAFPIMPGTISGFAMWEQSALRCSTPPLSSEGICLLVEKEGKCTLSGLSSCSERHRRSSPLGPASN